MLLTGELLEAEEAEELGLVMNVYPQEELMSEAYKLANKIAGTVSCCVCVCVCVCVVHACM
jgi:enoyl-CoA hydratase/carnithine racemase